MVNEEIVAGPCYFIFLLAFVLLCTQLDRLLVLHPALAKPLTGPQLARAEVNVDLLWSSLAPIHEGDIVKVVIRHPNVSVDPSPQC